MRRWEYLGRIVDGPVGEKAMASMNNLGADRWELISVVYDAESRETRFFFKRERLDDTPYRGDAIPPGRADV